MDSQSWPVFSRDAWDSRVALLLRSGASCEFVQCWKLCWNGFQAFYEANNCRSKTQRMAGRGVAKWRPPRCTSGTIGSLRSDSYDLYLFVGYVVLAFLGAHLMQWRWGKICVVNEPMNDEQSRVACVRCHTFGWQKFFYYVSCIKA